MLARSSLTELGLAKFPWWQDWRDRAVAIVACGPSAKKVNVAALRARLPVIAIKEAVTLCPWADVVYGCDGPWWRHKNGLPSYKGLKVSFEKTLGTSFPDIKFVDIPKQTKVDEYVNELLLDTPGVIGGGGNSGFQALNLALQFGASRLLLVAFDMNPSHQEHWYGRNNWMKANNPTAEHYRKWLFGFSRAAIKLKSMGVEIVNASPLSAMTCFPRATIEDTLSAWDC